MRQLYLAGVALIATAVRAGDDSETAPEGSQERARALIRIGPNPHAQEMVIAYLPRHRILFQGDLFGLPNVPAPLGPPQASTIAFAQKLQELNLSVDRIAGVHGRTATMQDLRKALEPG